MQFEIWKALVQAVLSRGGTDEHLRRIITDKTLPDKLAELIVGVASPVTSVATPTPTGTNHKKKEGWKLVENEAE